MISEQEIINAADNWVFNIDKWTSADIACGKAEAFEAGAKWSLAHVQSVPYPDNTNAFDNFGVSDKK